MLSDFVKTMLAYREGRIKLEYTRADNVMLVLNLSSSEYRFVEKENKEETRLAIRDSDVTFIS